MMSCGHYRPSNYFFQDDPELDEANSSGDHPGGNEIFDFRRLMMRNGGCDGIGKITMTSICLPFFLEQVLHPCGIPSLKLHVTGIRSHFILIWLSVIISQ
jgi:hypothetical protein